MNNLISVIKNWLLNGQKGLIRSYFKKPVFFTLEIVMVMLVFYELLVVHYFGLTNLYFEIGLLSIFSLGILVLSYSAWLSLQGRVLFPILLAEIVLFANMCLVYWIIYQFVGIIVNYNTAFGISFLITASIFWIHRQAYVFAEIEYGWSQIENK